MANITKYDPFAELQALQKQFFGDDWFTQLPNSIQLPTTDIYTEGDKRMVVEAHLPNFNEDDATVDIDNGMLEIQAERHETYDDKDKKYMVRETSSSFYRRIRLPEQADTSRIEARMDKGILKITVPFKKLPASKMVNVLSGKTNKPKRMMGGEKSKKR